MNIKQNAKKMVAGAVLVGTLVVGGAGVAVAADTGTGSGNGGSAAIDKAVANGKLTQDKADAAKQAMPGRIDKFLSRTWTKAS